LGRIHDGGPAIGHSGDARKDAIEDLAGVGLGRIRTIGSVVRQICRVVPSPEGTLLETPTSRVRKLVMGASSFATT
jgi:hypothetical protein